MGYSEVKPYSILLQKRERDVRMFTQRTSVSASTYKHEKHTGNLGPLHDFSWGEINKYLDQAPTTDKEAVPFQPSLVNQ